jgi:hypothetical protein
LRENVTAQIASVLAARKAGLIDQCWKPNAAAAPPGQSSHWTFNFTIGADGGQITRGVTEAHDSSRPEITACVLGALEPLSVSPPGAMVVVDVPFELP